MTKVKITTKKVETEKAKDASMEAEPVNGAVDEAWRKAMLELMAQKKPDAK